MQYIGDGLHVIHGHMQPIARRVNPIRGWDSGHRRGTASRALRVARARRYHSRVPPSRVTNDDAVRFGAIVARLRMERGWTLAHFAEVSGMNATWLGVLERGGNVPSLTTILQLAEVFGVEAAELVCEVERARRGATAAG